jgi:hypothetical protein
MKGRGRPQMAYGGVKKRCATCVVGFHTSGIMGEVTSRSNRPVSVREGYCVASTVGAYFRALCMSSIVKVSTRGKWNLLDRVELKCH